MALPLNAGVLLLERNAGEFKVTVGGVVLTTNVTDALRPAGFPSGLSCVATAVKVCRPVESAGFALPEVQLPPVPVAVALETSVPSALVPS
jgi:hypothetical protein